jgi:hypothetical protein
LLNNSTIRACLTLVIILVALALAPLLVVRVIEVAVSTTTVIVEIVANRRIVEGLDRGAIRLMIGEANTVGGMVEGGGGRGRGTGTGTFDRYYTQFTVQLRDIDD